MRPTPARVEALWVAARPRLLETDLGRVAVFTDEGLLGIADDLDSAAALGVAKLQSLDFELRVIRAERVIALPPRYRIDCK